jgi:hypothetical protein
MWNDLDFRAFDGPPGSGKTRKIVSQAMAFPGEGAVITYTNDAAAVVRSRAPMVQAGTIYSLTWPYVKEFVDKASVGKAGSNKAYNQRKIEHIFDPALLSYVHDAPSSRPPHRSEHVAKLLHAWRGGDPPTNLSSETASGPLKFVLPLARWLEAGAPMPEQDRLDWVLIDEAQDVGWVELRAAAALVRAGGHVHAYGDPGQSIFGESKGVFGASLPPVWMATDDKTILNKGWRVGDPVASAAARVLMSYYDRPASTFRAEHGTQILTWDGSTPPRIGLVLAYSRRALFKAFKGWGLRKTAIVPKLGKADNDLVLSTGHSAKGAEADDVYLLPWSRQAIERFEKRDPATVRLLYVMMTRAKRRLFLPRTIRARLPL